MTDTPVASIFTELAPMDKVMPDGSMVMLVPPTASAICDCPFIAMDNAEVVAVVEMETFCASALMSWLPVTEMVWLHATAVCWLAPTLQVWFAPTFNVWLE